MSKLQPCNLASKLKSVFPLLCASIVLTSCMSSKREEELDKKIIELQSSTSVEVAKLREELLKKDLALGTIKSSSEDANRRVQGTKGELEDLRRQLNITQGAVDELNTKFNKFLDVATKSMGGESNLRISDLEEKTETLSARVGLLKLQTRKHDNKVKLSNKMSEPSELEKTLSTHFSQKEYKKTLALADQVLNSDANSELVEIALRYRAEAYFAIQDYDLAAIDLDDFLDRFPNNPKQPRMLLLAGDSWIYMHNYKMARIYYQKCIKSFPDKQECGAAKERIGKMPGG